MKEKVIRLLQRLEEVEQLLGQPETLSDQTSYRALTQEHAYLSSIKTAFEEYDLLLKRQTENLQLLTEESDEEMKALLKEDTSEIEENLSKAKSNLETLLVPPSPNDDRNTIIEIRAGTGGEEAALFVADCARMYKNFSAEKKWTFESLSSTSSGSGGFKEYIFVLSGKGVHRQMQYEAGTHRVQRVPATETQGRVHTSAVTVAVLMEPTEQEKVSINEADLRIETFRASGAGGQHVNVTDSAVRITHLPTSIVVVCQDERSQHKNKDKAMRILSAKIQEKQEKERQKEESDLRSAQVGSGDRSERIRTYNFPQNRITDHRIHYTSYDLDQFMEGKLEGMTSALVSYFYQEALNRE